VIAMALLICAFAPTVGSTETSWRIYLDDADITGPAAPIAQGDDPAVNVYALATALGLQSSVSGNELLLTDSLGTKWSARGGDSVLESPEKTLILDHPAVIQSSIAYIPIKAVAELTGLGLKVDKDARRIAHGIVINPTDPEDIALLEKAKKLHITRNT